MKANKKIALMVVLALFLALSACTRQATTQTAVAPTVTGEVPFPFTTPGDNTVAELGTQTAIAKTPQVVIATSTPPPAEAVAPTAPAEDTEAGGGIEAPTQAPAAAAAAVNTPVVTRPSSYTLQKGEWPICIARRYDLDISNFFAANGLNMQSKPAAGKALTIPSSGTWSSNYGSRTLVAHPTTYTVKSGESVYSIACKFGDVTPEAILAVNGLSGDVTVGSTINIP